MSSLTLSVAASSNQLTLSGVKSLGAAADMVATAIPTGGTPIPLGTLTAQPDGPYTMSASVPPGSYTVQVTTSKTLSSQTTSSCSVPQSTLTANGTNILGCPANAVITAIPTSGGSPIAIGSLTHQPPGPFSLTAKVPPGNYAIDVALTATLHSEVSTPCTVPPTLLTATGNNTLGVPADIVVTATPTAGGAPITVATLNDQPVGSYAVTAQVPPGSYAINMVSTAELSASASASATVTGSSQDIVATVTYNGTSYAFAKSTGTDMGNYVDPQGRFVQGCVLVRNIGLPSFSVFFRSDKQGGATREEVVFELGGIWTASAPFSMTGYTVTIVKGGTTLASVSVPQHYFRSRWRWQSAPRPVTANVPDLVAAGLLPHYDEAVTGGFTPASSIFTYTPMGLAGLTGDMRGTGERNDIGPVTEWQADYICTGRATALSTLLAQAEASGTMPWHVRNENTGAPIDTFVYDHASMYGNPSGANPWIPRDGALDYIIVPDPAHEPALAYVPFLLTGDPYYLEELHFAVNFNILVQPWNGRAYDVYSAIRAHAWSLRSAAQAVKVTPDILPSWFLPRSYFTRHLNANRDWMLATYVNNPAAPWSTFHTIEQTFGDNNEAPAAPSGTYCQDYMEEFEAFVLGWVVQMGFEDWRPIFEWKILNTIARTNGTSGWIRAWCTPYRQIMRASRTDPWLPDWAASWTLTQQRYPAMTYADPNVLAVSGNDISYPGYTLGVLAMADRLGVAPASAPHAWMAGQIKGLLTTQRRMTRKWCVS